MLDTSPRVIIVQNIGIFCVGNSLKSANIAVDLTETNARVISSVEETTKYRFIPEKKIFRMGQLANTKGMFQVMKINANHSVTWNNVPDQLADYKNSKTKSNDVPLLVYKFYF